MITIIIGIDCAVDPKNVGLARGRFEGTTVSIEKAGVGHAVVGAGLRPAPTQSTGSQAKDGTADVVDIISGWMIGDTPILIAMDAPLGWPVDLAEALAPHSAGKTIAAQPDNMFRRLTDHAIRDRLKKQSLDVGADRIGRTAHAALDLLQKLRMRTGQEIPLPWKPCEHHRVRAIEVYPAGTLTALFGKTERVPPYKGKDRDKNRRSILEILGHLRKKFEGLDVPDHLARRVEDSDHVLDAILCVLAGADFLAGRATAPTEAQRALATKEGWIWVRGPKLP